MKQTAVGENVLREWKLWTSSFQPGICWKENWPCMLAGGEMRKNGDSECKWNQGLDRRCFVEILGKICTHKKKCDVKPLFYLQYCACRTLMWQNGYRWWKWHRRPVFKSWTRLSALHCCNSFVKGMNPFLLPWFRVGV